jgi:hypothetical protein
MLDIKKELGNKPPLDLFRSSTRFWFRDTHIAFGLLDSVGDSDFLYWKWNRTTNNWRIAPIHEDKRLFIDQDLDGDILPDKDTILSYKPESRIAWNNKNYGTFAKLYKYSSFKRISKHAEIMRTCGDAVMGLRQINRTNRIIEWEWIEGTSLPQGQNPDKIMPLIQSLHDADVSNKEYLTLLNAEAISNHLNARVDAVSSWLEFLVPQYIDVLRSITRRIKVMTLLLKGLEPPKELHLLHGDLRRQNIIVEKRTSKPRLVDADHLAFGEREWDLSAWIADQQIKNEYVVTELVKDLCTECKLDNNRFTLYMNVWNLLYAIKSIEEKSDENIYHFARSVT